MVICQPRPQPGGQNKLDCPRLACKSVLASADGVLGDLPHKFPITDQVFRTAGDMRQA